MLKYARNRMDLIGRVGSVPTVHTLPTNFRVCTFWLVTQEIVPDMLTGSLHGVEWHRIVAWQLTGDVCYERFMFGDFVGIMGRLSTRRWHDDHGVTYYVTEIVAEDIMFFWSAYHRFAGEEWIVPDNIRADEPYQPPQEPDILSRHFWSTEGD